MPRVELALLPRPKARGFMEGFILILCDRIPGFGIGWVLLVFIFVGCLSIVGNYFKERSPVIPELTKNSGASHGPKLAIIIPSLPSAIPKYIKV